MGRLLHFDGKLAVVTGGGSGMGRELVRQLAAQGCSVAACDWHTGAVEQTAATAQADAGPGVLVNTSSVNGLWASLGPGAPNTAYSTAKFAVRGFTEALIEDLRTNAPQVRVVLVLPGHVGTDIVVNTRRAHGRPGPAELDDDLMAKARAWLTDADLLAEGATDDDVRQVLAQMEAAFREKAPLSAAQAATVILDGVRSGAWRILVGEDASMIDAQVRANPDASYDYAELFRGVAQPAAEPSLDHP
ncbi:MAG TPA: SDR family NAD(P)-dependent oxidoreductase [Streptosporangiaceae bacterium]|jgi:NAD(P)-dependent dehydrogenase (short-subunit alcohol dehydrogenase family)